MIPVKKFNWRATSFKLLSFFLVSCISIIFIVQSVSKLISDYSEQKIVLRNRSRAIYAKLYAEALNASPDPVAEAKRWHEQMGTDVRAEDPQGQKIFSTADGVGSIAEVEAAATRRVWTSEIKTGEFHKTAFAIVNLPQRHYLFLIGAAPFEELQLRWLSPMMGLIILILLANFFLIRWLFRPVAWLSDGIRRLGEGDFDVQVPCRSYDELGDLALSFNQTVKRVRGIVESKKQLLFDVSHELRSPLTRIKVALELDGAKAKEHVRKNVYVLESMIHELLESARLDSAHRVLQVEILDLGELVAAEVSMVQSERPGIIFKNIWEAPLMVQADRAYLVTCLKNVLGNALKYSKFQLRPVEVGLAKLGASKIRMTVRDFGVGVKPEERELIFEPFYRVDKARLHETGGYGLGLSLCRKIMDAHGGKITVTDPESGDGTVFILDFQIHLAELGRELSHS